MGEHPVVDRFRGWTRGLRTATVSTIVAAAALVPIAPVAAAAPTSRPVADAATSDAQAVHTPDPAVVSDDADAATPAGGSAASPHGTAADVTTVTLAGVAVLPDITTTQAPRTAPTGTGLTRAPPAGVSVLPS
jgi:hypothetical protein